MKKNNRLFALGSQRFTKFLLQMKFTTAFILVASLQLSAKTFSQQRITLKLQSTELKTALKQIEKKSMYRFLYNNDVLSATQKISIDANNSLVTEVLNDVFSNTTLAYRILDNNLVVITQKNIATQDIKVTGKVTNASGEALPGVSIKIKGSGIGTSTDATGHYSISVPEGAKLIFSSIGYEEVEVAVNKRSEINITLVTSTKAIDAVVVIGYGTANKRDLTGSIVKVMGKDIADKPNSNPVASLQGKVAGLSVVNNGKPGTQPDIRIRGTTSIGQVHPLYIVDGIFEDNIDYLNPNDIESMEILKDPSSLAIFGVKGATGVIAITTKKAKAGQTVINFNTTLSWKKLVDAPKFADSTTFKTLYAEELVNGGISATPNYTGLTSNTDWIKTLTRTANYQTANLSVSSSTEKNKFNFGVGYTKDQGIVQHIQLEKLNINLGDECKLNKHITVGTNLIVSRITNPYGYDDGDVLHDGSQVTPLLSSSSTAMTLQNLYGVTGSTMSQLLYPSAPNFQLSGVTNPLVKLQNEWDKTRDYTYRFVGSAFAEINFLKYFSWRSTVYGDMSNEDNRKYTPTYYTFNPVTNEVLTKNANNTGIQDITTSIKQFQQDHILTFKRNIDKHHLTAIGGFSTRYFISSNVKANAVQGTFGPIPNDSRFWYINDGFTNLTTSTSTSNQYDNATVSYLARALYNYANKYYLTLSYRDDGSSQITGSNRYQSFWAAGGGWEITKEKFMQNQKIFSYIKLKGSIGVLGNQSAYDPNNPSNANPYLLFEVLQTGNNGTTPFGNNLFNAAQAAYNPNPGLKWEQVHSQEVGVEANAFNDRLHFEFAYFNKKTVDLMTVVNNASLGIANGVFNGGVIRNWGEEFSASWNQGLTHDLTLRLNGNITFLNNKVLALNPNLAGGEIVRGSQNNNQQQSITQVGQPIAYHYGYIVTGLYQSNLDVLSSPNAASLGNYKPGDFKFQDVNKDGVINGDDRTKIGNPSPKFMYGGSINLSYKQWEFGIDVGGVYGNQIFRTWAALESPYSFVNYAAFQSNRWHGAGTSNWVPEVNSGERYNYVGSTYSIEDGSYFRVRTLQLAYSFSSKILSKAYIKNLRVFGNIQNLKTWKHTSGYSPEFGGDATSFGIDNGNSSSALPRITSLGLNVTF